RLDATNVVLPDVAVITSISLDHTQVLGNTVAQIAGEKAGIIKPGGMVVSARQAEAAQEVLAAACARSGARLISVGKDVTWQLLDFDSRCQYVRVSGRRGTYDVCLPLLGEHQMENAACAVAALEVLALKGAAVSHEDIVRGLSEVRWPGRLQVLRRRPWLVCDAAHNADSAAKLVKALRRYFAFEKAILVVGVSADKDVAGIVAALAPAFDEVLVTRSRHPRSAPPEMVASLFSRHGVRPSTCENAAGALQAALQLAGREDLVCVTGSLFLVGEVLASEKALPDAMPRK
ncbi:MAG: bifunctional folylpolyglutamate synthase/dihydrofolate synthase, partial [Chloroflexi bacterium]|nr:bifunctional folylpolyglutamate synthase/dihydrofolate synthase [Chloroflexota bacterium]